MSKKTLLITTFIRILLTLFVIYFIYSEAGFRAAFVLFLIAIVIEIYSWRLITRKLKSFKNTDTTSDNTAKDSTQD